MLLTIINKYPNIICQYGKQISKILQQQAGKLSEYWKIQLYVIANSINEELEVYATQMRKIFPNKKITFTRMTVENTTYCDMQLSTQLMVKLMQSSIFNHFLLFSGIWS